MSTRATYRFAAAQHGVRPTVTFYVHHDGYHAGAARYFWLALMAQVPGDLASRFFRANPRAEFTGGHETHGDTEFQYTVGGEGPSASLHVLSRRPGGWNWRTSYTGTLADFLAANSGMIDGFEPFKQVDVGWRPGQWLNRTQAQRALDSKVETLTMWARRARENGVSPINEGNWRSLVNEARDLIVAFPDLKSESSESVVTSEINSAVTAATTSS